MHRVVQQLSLQATIDRYLDREMSPAEEKQFIQHLALRPAHQFQLDQEIKFRNKIRREAKQLKASAAFMSRLRTALEE